MAQQIPTVEVNILEFFRLASNGDRTVLSPILERIISNPLTNPVGWGVETPLEKGVIKGFDIDNAQVIIETKDENGAVNEVKTSIGLIKSITPPDVSILDFSQSEIDHYLGEFLEDVDKFTPNGELVFAKQEISRMEVAGGADSTAVWGWLPSTERAKACILASLEEGYTYTLCAESAWNDGSFSLKKIDKRTFLMEDGSKIDIKDVMKDFKYIRLIEIFKD